MTTAHRSGNRKIHFFDEDALSLCRRIRLGLEQDWPIVYGWPVVMASDPTLFCERCVDAIRHIRPR